MLLVGPLVCTGPPKNEKKPTGCTEPWDQKVVVPKLWNLNWCGFGWWLPLIVFFGGGVRREGGWQFLSFWIIFNLWVKKILRLCGLIVVFCFFCFLLCGTHGFFILPSMRTKKHVYGMELPYADLLCQRVATWLPESVGVRCTRYHF